MLDTDGDTDDLFNIRSYFYIGAYPLQLFLLKKSSFIIRNIELGREHNKVEEEIETGEEFSGATKVQQQIYFYGLFFEQ